MSIVSLNYGIDLFLWTDSARVDMVKLIQGNQHNGVGHDSTKQFNCPRVPSRRVRSRMMTSAAALTLAAAAAPALAQTNPYLLTYDLRVDGTGAKQATVHDVGDIVTLDLFAHVYGTDGDLTNDAFQNTFGSFESSNGGLLGDLVGLIPPAPFNATYQTGQQSDLDGDGDLDLGTLATNNFNAFYFVRSATRVASDPNSDLFIGQVRFTVTSLSGDFTDVNWLPGSCMVPGGITEGAVAFPDGDNPPPGPGGPFFLPGTDPRVYTGAPVTIRVGDAGTPPTDTLLASLTLPTDQTTYEWSTGNLIVPGTVQINSGGTFHQTGGTASFNSLDNTIADGGVLNLESGTLNANTIILTGSSGGISQNGGSLNAVYVRLKSSSSPANYTLNDGSLSATALVIGIDGNGTFVQNSGSASISRLQVLTQGSTATYQLNGGQLDASAAYVCYTTIPGGQDYPGTGSVTQSGGSATFGNLSIGVHGTYTLSGGSLTINKTLKNYGTIDLANAPVTLTAGPTSFLDFSRGQFLNTSSATVTGVSGSLMNFAAGYDPLTAIGHFFSDGLVHINGQPLVIPATATVHGSGSIEGDVTNQGAIAPGNSPGEIDIVGSYTQDFSASMLMELAGNTSDQFDILTVNGTASLGGDLSVALLDGYVPSPTDQFQIVTAGSLNGSFANALTGIDLPGGHFDVLYSPTGVTLANFTSVPEPAALTLIASALVFGSLRRRRKLR